MGRYRSRSAPGGRRSIGILDEPKIQKIVDERQQARTNRDFTTADRLRDELYDMGVSIDDLSLTWRGPDRMEGKVSTGEGGKALRREGDWDCASCGLLVFASKDSCFKCGSRRPGGRPAAVSQRREGDWSCQFCGTLVFAQKEQCYKCGAVKEVAKSGLDDGGRYSSRRDREDDDDRGGRRRGRCCDDSADDREQSPPPRRRVRRRVAQRHSDRGRGSRHIEYDDEEDYDEYEEEEEEYYTRRRRRRRRCPSHEEEERYPRRRRRRH
eukprot:TRINITY_DN6880_c0_g1_i1.p1 TRINITY_DN6880_c0_g1~~TRINITY_DN6880_c0_g1_i1.p1  ORF type:complete len:292 (+),score=56.62 TRINITY_DN6880_c0_g1_i1:76-876(+)